MPVTVHKRGSKYRVVEKSTGHIAKSKKGKPMDGGGHMSKSKAMRQMRAMNSK